MFFYEGFSILDSLMMVGFLSIFCWLVVANPRILILSILLINLGLSAASFYFLELGGYITELGRFSYRTNNLFFHLLYVLLFLSVLVFFSSQTSRFFVIQPNEKRHEISIYSGINVLVGAILLLVIITEYSSLVLYGIPIIQGQNKVDVAVSNVVVMYLGSTGTYVSVFFGMMFTATRRKLFLFFFILHFLFCILSAQKFSALINNMMFFIAPQLVFIDRLRITKKLLIFSVLLVAVILLVFFAAYDNENAFSRELGLPTWLAMGYRALYLSSHAQWAVFESLHLSGDIVGVTIEQFLNFHKFLVEQLHPMDTSESLEKGVTFGMIYPAYLVYAVPAYLHPIAILVFAGLLAFVFELFVWSVKSGRVVLACLVCVILNILARVFITGNFSLLFSGTMVLGILLALVYILILPKTNRPDVGGELKKNATPENLYSS